MLISFSAENWMSFKDKFEFSMLASRERRHGERVPRLPKHKISVLPTAAAFGGNASGKTNFFRAFAFVKRLVVDGVKPDAPIPVQPFKLSPATRSAPTSFRFHLLCGEDLYDFGFTLNSERIVRERLSWVKGKREYDLYLREEDSCDFPNIENIDKEYYKFIFKSTRNNQLFLTKSVDSNSTLCKPVYDWFKNSLHLIGSEDYFSKFEFFYSDEDQLFERMNELINGLDNGISRFYGEISSLDTFQINSEMIQNIKELKDGDTIRLANRSNRERLVITKRGDQLVTRRLVTIHKGEDGEEVKFSLGDESDGTLRAIDLVPAFLELMKPDSNSVFLIDELDRSLHSLVISELIEQYLYTCFKNSRAQLIFSTQDILQMTQFRLRRDEMWLFSRNPYGATTFETLYSFKGIKNSTNLPKEYLSGRYFGIQNIFIPYKY